MKANVEPGNANPYFLKNDFLLHLISDINLFFMLSDLPHFEYHQSSVQRSKVKTS